MKHGLIFVLLCAVLLALVGCNKPAETDEVKKEDTIVDPIEINEETPQEEVIEDDSVYLDMQDADFSIYDGTLLRGPDVRQALGLFRNSNVAVLVATQMVMDGTIELNELDGNVDADMPTAAVKGIEGAITTSGESLSEKLTFVNYGAVLKGEEVLLEFKDNYLIAKEGLEGDKIVNLRDSKATTDGYAENIADYLRMSSHLVKDADGSVIGVAFYAVPF